MMRAYSIRSRLLKWLFFPMLILVSLDSTILYHFANKLEGRAFDHELQNTANDVAEFIKKSSQDQLVGLDAETSKALLSDPTDQMFYSVETKQGEVLIGEPQIGFAKNTDQLTKQLNPIFYTTRVNGEEVRTISIADEIEVAGKTIPINVQVAETLKKRNQLQHQILIWITLPQIFLLIASGILVWVGVERGLIPLTAVNDDLSKRSYRDLQPIKLDNIPKEVKKLVSSINGLMAELSDAINSQNRFIANAAHQLRTPLAGILAQIELAEDSENIDEIKERLRKVFISSSRLIHLVNQLLILAKNQPEAIHQISLQPFDLVEFIKRITIELAPNADVKEIDLGYEGSNEKIYISGEKTSLRDLAYNLIDNAIRYTPKGGKVTTYVSIKDQEVCFAVEDNGIGIPVNERELVFERFYRSSQTKEFGTGVGLAIVKEIADLHAADIEINHGSNGEGTMISVYFPLVLEPSSSSA